MSKKFLSYFRLNREDPYEPREITDEHELFDNSTYTEEQKKEINLLMIGDFVKIGYNCKLLRLS